MLIAILAISDNSPYVRPDQCLTHALTREEPARPITQNGAVKVVVDEAGDAPYGLSVLWNVKMFHDALSLLGPLLPVFHTNEPSGLSSSISLSCSDV